MNALQPQHYPSPTPPQKPRGRHRTRQRQSPHRALAAETAVKLGVNLLFVGVAVSTLFRLIPSNLEQQQDLQRLKVEVAEANHKVASLQSDFDRHFDPQQAMNVMQEQNIRFDPRQRQVVWLNAKRKLQEEADTADTADTEALEENADVSPDAPSPEDAPESTRVPDSPD